MGQKFIDEKINWRPDIQAAFDYVQKRIDDVAGGGPHTHAIADVTNLQTALDGKEATGVAAAAVATHAGAADPHSIYLTLAEANALYEALGAVTTHEAAADPHPVYLRQSEADLLYEAAGAVSAHAGAADPHTGYQKESEKGVANGYPSLGAGGLVPIAQLASGTPPACGHSSS